MDIRALRYFSETVRLNSFSRAADALHVTQSTVSKMVRQLEDEMGVPLLIRAGRSLQLTDTGRVVYEQAPTAPAAAWLARVAATMPAMIGVTAGQWLKA